MILPEGIAVASFVISTVGFMYKMSRDVADIRRQVSNDIQHIAEEEQTKRSRIYERLDEYKKTSEEKFVTKDLCHLQHEQTNKILDEMRQDIKTLLNKK